MFHVVKCTFHVERRIFRVERHTFHAAKYKIKGAAAKNVSPSKKKSYLQRGKTVSEQWLSIRETH